ncbi:MAG: SPOR domain-containing protein [Chitinophagaceae bacterium]
MKRIIVLALSVFSLQAFSQDSSTVMVHKDPRVDLLVNKQAQINELTSRDARKSGKGFRLLIMRTNNRDEAMAAKTKVYTYFPELKAYLWHQSPYYNVKAGNFRDRKEAEAYQKKMNVYFPKGVYVMNDVVEVKLEKQPWEDSE